jgi:hypothetical protein
VLDEVFDVVAGDVAGDVTGEVELFEVPDDVVDLVDVVEPEEDVALTEWLTPATRVAVSAAPATAAAAPATPARRTSLGLFGFSVMGTTIRPRGSGPHHRSVKTFLSRGVDRPCADHALIMRFPRGIRDAPGAA